MDIWEALRRDEERILGLLDKLEATSLTQPELREELMTDLACELEAHARAEDSFFYPLVFDRPETRGGTIASRDENRTIHEMADGLLEADKADAGWETRLRLLSARIRSHIEREEKELVPRARRIIEEQRARELGPDFVHLHDEALAALRGAV